MEEKTIGGLTTEKKDDYGNGNYFETDIDIYPMTSKQQRQLTEIFDILEIPHSSILFGHTYIKIATRELNHESVKELMDKGKRDSLAVNIDKSSKESK